MISTENLAKEGIEESILVGFKMKKGYALKSAYTQKVQYGKSDSRRAIANVLDAVLNTYKYNFPARTECRIDAIQLDG